MAGNLGEWAGIATLFGIWGYGEWSYREAEIDTVETTDVSFDIPLTLAYGKEWDTNNRSLVAKK